MQGPRPSCRAVMARVYVAVALPHAHPNVQAHAPFQGQKDLQIDLPLKAASVHNIRKNLLFQTLAQKLQTPRMQCHWHLHCTADTPKLRQGTTSPLTKGGVSPQSSPARNFPSPLHGHQCAKLEATRHSQQHPDGATVDDPQPACKSHTRRGGEHPPDFTVMGMTACDLCWGRQRSGTWGGGGRFGSDPNPSPRSASPGGSRGGANFFPGLRGIFEFPFAFRIFGFAHPLPIHHKGGEMGRNGGNGGGGVGV